MLTNRFFNTHISESFKKNNQQHTFLLYVLLKHFEVLKYYFMKETSKWNRCWKNIGPDWHITHSNIPIIEA